MEMIDEVTIRDYISPFCPDCGHMDNIEVSGEPFYDNKNVVIPLKCNECSFYFSMIIKLRVVK